MDRFPWSRCHCNRPIAAEGVVWWALRGLEGHVCSVWKLGPTRPPFPVSQREQPNCGSSGEPICECMQETDGNYSRSLSHRHQSSPSPDRFNFKLVYRWLGEREICPSVSFNLLNYWKQPSKRKWEKIMYKCTMTTIKRCQLMFNWICLYYFLQIYLIFITLNRDQVPFTNSTSHPV